MWDIEAPKKRLFRFKGSARVLVTKLSPTVGSLNSGDSFMLDSGALLCVWHGARASQRERAKAEEFARKMQAEECA